MAWHTWDDYFIPGTTVLKNREGITDAELLSNTENAATLIRLSELLLEEPPREFNLQTFQSVHRHIFQDVYDWAGEIRRVPEKGVMSKAYRDVVKHDPSDMSAPLRNYGYLPAARIPLALDYAFGQLEERHWLTGLSADQFISALAESWGDINMIHPFREGNTRTQIAFFSMLADNAGHRLDTSLLQWGSPLRDEFLAARFHNMATGSTQRLEKVVETMLAKNPNGTTLS